MSMIGGATAFEGLVYFVFMFRRTCLVGGQRDLGSEVWGVHFDFPVSLYVFMFMLMNVVRLSSKDDAIHIQERETFQSYT